MRMFMCGLYTETNSFSPVPIGRGSFAGETFHGDATAHPPGWASAPMHIWKTLAEQKGYEVIESLCASAGSGAPVVRAIYEELRDEILNDLRSAGDVDMVLLSLHGSMIAEGYDDCEGDLLERVRSIVGPDVVIGAELDPHCSITRKMVAAANILITYKLSPHTDVEERAPEVFALCDAAVRREIKPVTAIHECRMVSTWPTDREPMAGFVRHMMDCEGRGDILSVSFAHDFGLADVPEGGAKVLVIANGNAAAAETLARDLGQRLWDMRRETARTWESLDAVLDKVATAKSGPIVIADFCDNSGGGAPSDSTHILRALVERGIGNSACGFIWDQGAVGLCIAAGEGAKLDLRIGGKVCRASGQPLDLNVTVMRIIENASQHFAGTTDSIGDAVCVRTDDAIDIVLTETRQQIYQPDAFTQFGIELTGKRAIIVKSSNHFRAGFAPIATEILYPATDGLLTLDYATVPYTKFKTPFWPCVEDPFEAR
ncbi:microcystin degradation protein MlrC [Mesorhizobium loti]|uniref:Microcystinase C n=1 Tax=Rhizobium loti TaxID=381 RepID=A0A8E3B382_RHILI|nr:M81 family metallopeptidase [Mesorhizobium loti]PWJ88143.1 microcystin degradation protein MlrC [Mesorhizobium loti]